MKVYSKFQEMVDDSDNYGLPMSILFAEAFNQVFGRLTLLEEDHDKLIKENRKLKKELKKNSIIKINKPMKVGQKKPA
jgi:hypothetical protein